MLSGDGSERGSWHVGKASLRLASRYSWVQCKTSMHVALFVDVVATVVVASVVVSIA